MGWKNVKEFYKIGHIVQVVEPKGICIGSPFIHDLIVISLEGEIKKRADGRGNADLLRYMMEFDADPKKLRDLVLTPDTFERSLPVFTYSGGAIIEKRCEKYGYPNPTHDGELMYENTFSRDRDQVIEWAIKSAKARVELIERCISEKRKEVADLEWKLDAARIDLAELKREGS